MLESRSLSVTGNQSRATTIVSLHVIRGVRWTYHQLSLTWLCFALLSFFSPLSFFALCLSFQATAVIWTLLFRLPLKLSMGRSIFKFYGLHLPLALSLSLFLSLNVCECVFGFGKRHFSRLKSRCLDISPHRFSSIFCSFSLLFSWIFHAFHGFSKDFHGHFSILKVSHASFRLSFYS